MVKIQTLIHLLNSEKKKERKKGREFKKISKVKFSIKRTKFIRKFKLNSHLIESYYMQAIIQGCYNMYQRYNSFYKIMLNVFIINNSAINEDKLFILHRSHLVTVFFKKKTSKQYIKEYIYFTFNKKN